MKNKRYTVLTYNINNYEVVHEVENPDPEAEYIMVTDTPELHSKTWTVLYDKDLMCKSAWDACVTIRYNCFKYCHADICVRIDGSMGIKQSLRPLIDVFEDGNYDACLMPHPHRDVFADEYNAWIEQRSYPKDHAQWCLQYMKDNGYDLKYKGLFQSGFAIQRRGELTERIDTMCLKILKEMGADGKYERLEQIPLTYVLNKYFSNIKVLPISSQIFSSPYLQLYMHGGNEFNLNHMPDMTKKDIHYMFNKKVECMYLLPPMGDVVTDSDRKEIARREYELLWKIRMLQNSANAEIIDNMNKKARKHLRTIRCLIATSVVLLISLIAVIIYNL